MTDDKTDLVGVSERLFVIEPSACPATGRRAWEGLRLIYIDQRESLLAALQILGIVARLAWRREIARRRLWGWVRAFAAGWFSRKLWRIVPDSGFCYRALGPLWAISDRERSSMLILVEDGIPLDAPHSPHDEIRRLGRGRYSHWGRQIYFSSSDNTDPRKNGRAYKLIKRA